MRKCSTKSHGCVAARQWRQTDRRAGFRRSERSAGNSTAFSKRTSSAAEPQFGPGENGSAELLSSFDRNRLVLARRIGRVALLCRPASCCRRCITSMACCCCIACACWATHHLIMPAPPPPPWPPPICTPQPPHSPPIRPPATIIPPPCASGHWRPAVEATSAAITVETSSFGIGTYRLTTVSPQPFPLECMSFCPAAVRGKRRGMRLSTEKAGSSRKRVDWVHPVSRCRVWMEGEDSQAEVLPVAVAIRRKCWSNLILFVLPAGRSSG